MLMSCIGVVACLSLGLVCCQDMKNNQAYRDPLLSGLIFTENLLFERNVKSKLGCASECLKSDDCVTFTFTSVTSANDLCRGHSARMNSGQAHNVSVGTYLYAIHREPEEDWLNAACNGDEECSQPNTICFKGQQCMCKPAFYYSVCRKTCQETCIPEDLQNSYLQYPGGATWDAISGQTKLYTTPVEYDACRQACTGSSQCLYYEYRDDASWCVLETDNPRNMTGSVIWRNAAEWVYYQRNCL